MKIALIWPKSTFLIDPMVYPPLGLWYVRAALEAAGHSTDYFDLDVDELPTSGYDQYWVSGTTPQASELKRVGRELTENFCPAVLGGVHTWKHAEEMLDYYSWVVRGEVFTVDSVNKVLEARPNRVLDLGRQKTLDELPLPDRRAAMRYRSYLEGRRSTTAITSLGCPFHCAFCESHDLWGAVRYVPLEKVIADINVIAEQGFEAVQFYDDILPIKPKRTLAIAKVLSALRLTWRCFLRSDLAVKRGKEFLKTLAARGLREVLVGVESASQRIKDNINKGTTVEQDTTLRRWCKELGISFKASVILGLPGETWETMEETRRWLLENRPDRADVNTLIPMPGTPLYDRPEEFDCHWTTATPDEFFYKGKPGELGCLVSTKELSAEDILTFRNKLVEELGVPY